MNDWLLLLFGILLTAGTGVFVAAEFSLVALDRHDLERRRSEGQRGLDGVIRGLTRTSTHLSSAQLGITLTTLLAGYTLEPALSGFLDAPLGALGVPEGLRRAISAPVAVAIATVFSMIVGELVPKNFALAKPLGTARVVMPAQAAFTAAFKPAVMVLNGSANGILRSIGIEPKEELSGARSAEELSSLVRHSASAALRKRVDSKIVTTQLGDEAGAPSVPNILTVVESWDDLLAKASAAGLRTGSDVDLVVQSAYGDSGRTTFFVTEESDYDGIADWIHGREVKVMKRVNHRPLAAEVVLTRSGPVIGPCLNEITGHAELTSFRGGWAGSEMSPAVLDAETLGRARELIRRFSVRLGEEGYRGVFEVSVLLDTDTGEVYLGELNPRISGSSSLSTMTAAAYADLPLFALHILEFSGVDFEFDVDAVNERWAALASTDTWSTLIIKHQSDRTERIAEAPRSGRYDVSAEGDLAFAAAEPDWLQLTDESEAYYLRFLAEDDVREPGDDLGILVTRRTLLEDTGELSPVAKRLISSIRGHYRGE